LQLADDLARVAPDRVVVLLDDAVDTVRVDQCGSFAAEPGAPVMSAERV
jgi:hypothetical protein